MDGVEAIDTAPWLGRAFISHDPRNLNFPARTLLPKGVGLRERVWRRGAAYNQGPTPHCVAHTAKGMLNTAPFSAFEPYHRRSAYPTVEWYGEFQKRDQWPGESYDGTSAQGALAYLTETGKISEYRWCFGLEDVLLTLSHVGPVGVGSWWRSGMWEPDPDSHLLSYEGSYEGGHQFEAIGVHPDVEEVEFMNSWGTEWGDRGRFRMKFDQFETLLADDADAHTFVTVN